MAWNTQKMPLEYLLQRVEYYKKSLRRVENYKKNGKMSERFTDEQIDLAISNIKYRLSEFEKACAILAQNMD